MDVSARVRRASFARCPGCGKHVYRSRSHAKKAARTNHPGDRMSVYECRHPDGQGWHYGHTNWWRWYRDQANAA